MLALARPQLGLLSVATVALLVATGMSLAFPWMVGQLVDLVSKGSDLAPINQAAMLLFGVFVVQSAFAAVRAWSFTLAGERVVAQLRKDLFSAIVEQEMAFFDESRTGELTNRLASDTTVLQNAVTVNVSMALRYVVGGVGGVVLLVWMSPALTGITLVVVPVVVFGGAVYGRWVRTLSRKIQDALARSTSVAEEAISGIRTVRAFGNEAGEQERYGQAVDDSYRLSSTAALAYGGFQGLGGLAGYGALTLVVWYGARMVVAEELSLGELTSFLLYSLSVAFSLGALAGLYGDLMRALGASERVFDLLHRSKGIEAGGGEPVGRLTGAIRFEDVRFAYPTRPEVAVIDGITLDVAPGDVVALVGPSGAGKSTISSLLLRFYDPQSGRVLVDGMPLPTLNTVSLRRAIGVVAQEPILFAATIAENLRYGRPGASDAEVREAAKAANALDFIEAFPQGFETLVGERGVRLSGGQKQRVAIARALLKDPGILVLDEATSALDAENEHLVKEALERLMRGRTTLVIAHRLSTIRGADRVVVMQGGRIAETGKHDDLMAANGLYRRLVERQIVGDTAAA